MCLRDSSERSRPKSSPGSGRCGHGTTVRSSEGCTEGRMGREVDVVLVRLCLVSCE